jgi:hypothetical protein
MFLLDDGDQSHSRILGGNALVSNFRPASGNPD